MRDGARGTSAARASLMRTRLAIAALLAAPAVTLSAACARPYANYYDYAPGDTRPNDPPDSGFVGMSDAGTHPDFGPVVTQAVAPPPISGGTLIITKDDAYAVASDPDRDQVHVVDLEAAMLARTIALTAGDEPGRLAEDAAGRVHVALRRSGDLATIDVATGRIVARRRACSAPRGVAHDAVADTILVACAGGELVTFPAAGGDAVRTVLVDSDLRDVVLVGRRVYVSRFRSAELLELDATGAIVLRVRPPSTANAAPEIAWRTIALPDGSGLAMVHQRASVFAVAPTPGGYGSGTTCAPSVVATAVTIFALDGRADLAPSLDNAVLPVDVAIVPRGLSLVVAAGNSKTAGLPHVVIAPGARPPPDAGTHDAGGEPPCLATAIVDRARLTPTAIATDTKGRVFAQSREPAVLYIVDPAIGILPFATLSLDSRADTGHDIFHANAGAQVACASCHAEGADDGRVWSFAQLGSRRTPSLRGTVGGTAPYHWDGAMTDFAMLEHEIFEGRMSGPQLSSSQLDVLAAWVGAIPAPPPMTSGDPAAIARGKAFFTGSAGCIGCHSGPKHTNNTTVDVGTGSAFQVPPLVGVAWRAPYLHDGCAATLRERFTSCGGPMHGSTSAMTSAEIDDLVSYLKSL